MGRCGLVCDNTLNYDVDISAHPKPKGISAALRLPATLASKEWSVMLPNARLWFVASLLAVTAIFCASRGHSQTFNLENDRVQMAELHGMWRFHTGDDPDGKLGWTTPAFDDSSWTLLRSDQPWSKQGYTDYGGMAWYRFKVILPAKHPPLALYIPEIDTSYQVFAGGRLIGHMGGLPPHERALNHRPAGAMVRYLSLGQVIPIPDDAVVSGSSLPIAIRVWRWPYWILDLGGPLAAIRIGNASL
jgi:hypothetical protein